MQAKTPENRKTGLDNTPLSQRMLQAIGWDGIKRPKILEYYCVQCHLSAGGRVQWNSQSSLTDLPRRVKIDG